MSTAPPPSLLAVRTLASKLWRNGTLVYTTSGLAVLFFWLLLGDFALSTRDRQVGSIFTLLLKKFHGSNLLISTYTAVLPGAIHMLLGPVVSYKSDRYRSKWGRRIPFLLVATPVTALALVGLGLSPCIGAGLDRWLGPSSPGPNVLTLGAFGLFWAIYEVLITVSGAVLGAFFNDVVPRPVLGRFFGLVRAVSLSVGIFTSFFLFGKASVYYAWIFAGIAVVYTGGLLVMCLKVREGQYPPPPPAEAGGTTRLGAVRVYFRECFTKPYYYWVFAVTVLPTLAFMPMSYTLFLAQSLGMSDDSYGKIGSLYLSISLGLTIPLGWLVDKFHPLRVGAVALGLHCAVCLWAVFFVRSPLTFGIAWASLGAIQGIWFTATAALHPLLLPKAKYAQYASAVGMVATLIGIGAAPLLGLILDLLHNWYRFIFYASFVLDAPAFLAVIILYRKYMAMGGPKSYVAPE